MKEKKLTATADSSEVLIPEEVVPGASLHVKPEINDKDVLAFQRNAGMMKVIGLYDAMEDIRQQMIVEQDNKKLWKLQTRLGIFQKYLELYSTAGKIAQAQSMLDLSDSTVTEVKLSLKRKEETDEAKEH